jgi:CRISPR-associated protein Csx10
MKTFSINLKVVSPLAIRADHATTRSGSTDFIPGNTLLGALATVHRVFRKEQQEEFERLFLRGETLYSNLYPAMFEIKDESLRELLQENLPIYPLPKTAQSCKRHKGFVSVEGQDSDAHGVRDTLVDWAMFRLGKDLPSEKMIVALEKNKNCKKCREPMHHLEGYYRHLTVASHSMVKVENSSRLQTRTGIDRDSGTVREGILYNRQVFEEGSRFWGEICLPDDEALTASFTSFVREVNGSHFLRLGTGRTRGMGKVEISIQPISLGAPEERLAKLRERIDDLDKRIHKQIAKTWEADVQQFEKVFFFALTLHSTAILIDEFLRYHGRIDEDVLCELLGIESGSYGLQECYTNTSTKRITGWQELWGTPRTNEFAIDTGSVFLFQCHRDKYDELTKKLFDLEEQGIGNRRAEGFGRVCVSDPFHMRDRQE